jgi:AcrR family transcriptional regulator
MGRPRRVDDETLLDAALAIIGETGPDSLSFDALAARVDIVGSTFVKRFESKSNLLQSALLLAWDRLDADTARAIRRAGPGSKGVVQLLVSLSRRDRADERTNQVLLLRQDLRDPVLRARGQACLAELAAAIDTPVGTARPPRAHPMARHAHLVGFSTPPNTHRRRRAIITRTLRPTRIGVAPTNTRLVVRSRRPQLRDAMVEACGELFHHRLVTSSSLHYWPIA